jgi:hypothetical protein
MPVFSKTKVMTSALIKKLFCQLWCRLVGGIRCVYFLVRKQEPELLYLEISDAVLVNDRVVRVKYASKNVCSVHIVGIARSHKCEENLVFNVPEGLDAITVLFIGAQYTIERKQHFHFLKVELEKAPFLILMNTIRHPEQVQHSTVKTLQHIEIRNKATTSIAKRLWPINSRKSIKPLVNQLRIILPYP